MTFKRELILERLVEIAETLGAKTVVRNVISISDDQMPAIAVLEGDEEADADDPQNRPNNSPRVVWMTPHIIIAVGRNPQASPPEELGPTLNAFLAALVKAVLTDSALADLTLDKRGARYVGTESDLAVGRNRQGQFAAKFAFKYGLVPNDL